MESTVARGYVSHDSILFTHGTPTPRAYLLLHGLTASPKQFERFGALLFERGSNVSIPRLPRHGFADRLTDELAALTADELRAFARTSVAEMGALSDEICVVGFSVGGLVAAWIAQEFAVARATAVAPFLGVAWLPSRILPHAVRLALGTRNRFIWWDPIRRERLMPEHGYPRVPTHAVAHAAELAAEVFTTARRESPRAREIQIVLNGSETTVNNRAARKLAAIWQPRHAGVSVHQIGGFPPSHDIVEPLRDPHLAARLYPLLLALVDR